MNPTGAGDPFDLDRFVKAQEGCHARALAELRAGAKRSHWMWYVFPQLAGLGLSATAVHYAIADLAEARAYLAHPLLGPRLEECARALLDVPGRTAREILGSPDDLKLRSSMTLFAQVTGADPVFRRVLERYYGGEADARTLELLASS
jgi:uncharacterized protein (DUF1810 family)